MKKWMKWGIIFAFLHLFIFTMPLYIYNLPGKGDYEALGLMITLIIYIYEAPLFLFHHVLSIATDYTDVRFVLINCILGAILYFFIGALFGYARSLPKKAHKIPRQKIKNKTF